MNILEGERTFDLLISLGSKPQTWEKVLYIGWHPNTFGTWNGEYYIERILKEKRKESTHFIIERAKVYFDKLVKHKIAKLYNIKCINADIVDWSKKNVSDKFDLVIWWHGPEHVEEENLANTLSNLERICNNAVILGLPDGSDPRNIESEYEDEIADDKHHNNITELDLNKLGYTTVSYTRDDRRQGKAITAIKLMNK